MKRHVLCCTLCLVLIFTFGGIIETAGQVNPSVISTNKDKLLTIAVQGQIAPAEPSRGYATTWDGKPKMAIGIGGIDEIDMERRQPLT